MLPGISLSFTHKGLKPKIGLKRESFSLHLTLGFHLYGSVPNSNPQIFSLTLRKIKTSYCGLCGLQQSGISFGTSPTTLPTCSSTLASVALIQFFREVCSFVRICTFLSLDICTGHAFTSHIFLPKNVSSQRDLP